MAEVGRVRSRLELEIRGFQRSLQRVERSLERTQRELRQTERVGTRSFTGLERSAGGLVATFRSMARATVVLGGALAGLQLGRVAVQLENVQSTLIFLTGSQEAAAGAFQRVRALSDQLGASTLDLAEAYVQLLGATRGAAFSQAEVEEIFRSLTTAGRALGRSNAELRLAFIGLGQALGSSNVQYQEIRQITEALPGTLAIMARALGKTTGEFREFIATGQAAPREVFLPFARAANEEFLPALQQIDTRVTTAFNRIRNAVTEFVNAIVRTRVLEVVATQITIASTVINTLATGIENAVRAIRDFIRAWRGLPPIPRITIDIPGPSRRRMGGTERSQMPGLPIVAGMGQAADAHTRAFESIQQEEFELQLIFDRSRASILRNNAAMRQSFQQTASIVTTVFQSVGAAFAQMTIGILRGTQSIQEALSSLAESLAATFINLGIQTLLGAGQGALLGALGPGGGPAPGSAGGPSSGIPGIFGGPGGLLGRSANFSIINVPNASAVGGVSAAESAQGRQVIVNTLTEEFARGNASPVVQIARRTLGR